MDIGIYIIGIILIVLSIVIIILLIKSKNNSNDEKLTEIKLQNSMLSENISSEFEISRRDNASVQHRISDELNKNYINTAEQLSKMKSSNYENIIKLNESISSSLSRINETNVIQNEKQTEKIEQAISRMQESNEKKLEQMRATVDEKLNETLNTRLDSSFKTVSQQLENVYKSLGEMKELSTGVTNNVTTLNRVLTNVKARGTWAEVQLEGILNQTIPNMFVKNFAPNPSSNARVEFAVKIYSGSGQTESYLPIDSKFPMEDYVRLCDAADTADADLLKSARKALEDRIIAEAKDISKYINIPVTTPFAIMYLATEGLYAEIASSRTGVAEKIQSDYNVMIAGPTTITALLNSLALGFKAVAINEKANEVRELLAVTKAQYDKFGVVLEKAGKKIEEAGRTIEDARKRNSIIRKKLKNIDEINAPESDSYLGLEEGETGEI